MWEDFDSVTLSDIRALVTSGTPEGRDLEYKSELPTRADRSLLPFLASVCAFANTVGGHLVYGIIEDKGVATSCLGVGAEDADETVLTLEQMIRTGIHPVIPGVRTKAVSLADGKYVIVIHIPRSLAAPHCVHDNGRFYARNSAGKYPMDVTEIRRAFLGSEDHATRIRNFRLNRVASVMAGDTPVPLMPGAKGILHMVPVDALGGPPRIDIAKFERGDMQFRPLGCSGWDARVNVDGIVCHAGPMPMLRRDYTQLYRSGIVEAVQSFAEHDGRRIISIPSIEVELIGGISEYLRALASVAIPTPVYIFYALVGVKEYEFPRNSGYRVGDGLGRSDRDTVMFPEVVFADYCDKVEKVMHPLCDMMWNAFGYAGSPHFDDKGNDRR
jgi:hypothetical protein